MASGLCRGSSDVPLVWGASSSAESRFLLGGCVVLSGSCCGSGAGVDAPLATRSGVDMASVHQVLVNSVKCLDGCRWWSYAMGRGFLD